jgi:hypothetical protein
MWKRVTMRSNILELSCRLLLLCILLELNNFSTALQPLRSISSRSSSLEDRARSFINHCGTNRAATTSSASFRYLPLYGQSEGDQESEEDAKSILETLGLISQPIVWVSLYSVGTTGAGLPSGPFGLVGAVEGLSYVFVLGFAVASLVRTPTLKLVESLSWLTLGAGFVILCILVAQEGCVPNAKPLLDYSAYVPVCNPDQTPGLFGG